MSTPNFETSAVIGTGMMGPGIALTLALGGVRATILSRSEESASQGLDKARRQVALLRDNGLAGADQAARALELMDATSAFDDTVKRVGLVIESAPENMAFKQGLFAHMDSIARPDAVLASNTSGLSITAIASKCARPERVLTTHFWNPPHLMPLVEIVKGEKTSGEVASAVRDLLARCGKTPVVVKKDRPGQLGNRLQMALVREAIHIVAEGIADVEDVDLAAKSGFGLRLPVYGIFEHQDMVGLDMAFSIVDYVSGDLYNQPHAPALMKQLVDRGDLGVKSGKGFYDWSTKDAAAVRARRDQFVLDFLRRSRP
ncbi:MAG: 3-hydroxyacyl-CoA dehydrogenase family protein [Acidobacteria bacterium]|nr:3-hydroxyacyl-CoA dehydrogenase family protein [Acidobacteriota bacterium]